jgi:phosphonate transport system substrate-binding protein
MRSTAQPNFGMRLLRVAFLALAIAGGTNGFAQKTTGAAAVGRDAAKASESKARLTFAINEGAAGNADFAEIQFRYQDFSDAMEKALGMPVGIVSARNRDRLQENLKSGAYHLLLSRPNDVPAQAVRDFGYHPLATAKEPYQTLFIVWKDSTLKKIADVKGRTIVTPDQYSNMWRAANAMLRDANIDMNREKVKSMRDQAAIGWSLENGFYDVGVVNSASAVGRSWEKNGGRVIARSRDQINMPFIASPQLSAAQIARLRAAVLALDSNDAGRAILKRIGLPGGFKETPREEFLDFLKWLGEDLRRPV